MNNLEFVEKLKDIATNYKTLYVMGCFGAPMTDANKKRYTSNHSYNKQSTRTKMINSASSDTFGFDCVCLIKSLFWGWCGDKTKTYGGASYASNGVPDIDDSGMINVCSNISTDFNSIEVGELLWMKGHVGVYIGDGLAVECSPAWNNCVQITACNCSKNGYNRRNWTKHGKLPYITYEKSSVPVEDKPTLSVLTWQKAAIADGYKFPKYGADGFWGKECESVAREAICKKCSWPWKNKNLTKIIQAFLGIEVDGKFGNDTKAAVIQFQKLNGLVADGIVGYNTWRKILGV